MTDTSDVPDLPLGDDALTQRLLAGRPAPATPFRGTLRRRLMAIGPPAARPPRLWLLAGLHGAGGLVLLVVGLASVAGAGPLAS